MKRTVKQTLKKYLWLLYAFHRLIVRKKSYLHTTGWVESVKRGYPCDKSGTEIPWMNYPIINILKERLNKDMNLFEYGSGFSTMFYARLVKEVISIEYDKNWLDIIKPKVPDNVSLIFKEKDIDGKYCRAIHESEQGFDVVIVDGRDRVNCVKQAISKLTEKGVVVLDDSSREKYQIAISYAKEKGFRALSIEGLKPTGDGTDRTTILYRNKNCFNL